MIRESELLARALRMRDYHNGERAELSRRKAAIAADLPDAWELIAPMLDNGELVAIQRPTSDGLAVFSIKPGLSAGRVCVTIDGVVADRETGLSICKAPALIAPNALQTLSDAIATIEMQSTRPVELIASMLAIETITGTEAGPMVCA